MLEVIEWETLEQKTHAGRSIVIKSEDRIEIGLQKEYDKFLVTASMPWNETYTMRIFEDQTEAKKYFDKVNEHLSKGGNLAFIDKKSFLEGYVLDIYE